MRRALLLLPLLTACGPDVSVAPLIDLSDVPRNTERDFAEDGLLEVYFTEPGTTPGGGSDPLLDDALIAVIDAATTTLDVCLYDFELPGVSAAIVAAAERGVAVRMVGDGDEADDAGYVALATAGVPIVTRPPRDRIMHNKFVVADGQVVWTGSTNATETGLLRNNNNSLVIESAALADEYTAEFAQMSGGLFGRKKADLTVSHRVSFRDQDIVFHFAPAHDPIHALVEAVDTADHTIHFMIFSFTHPDLRDALLRARQRGVDVVGVYDESQARGRYSTDEAIAEAGVPVFIDGNGNTSGLAGGKLHHKVMIIDAGVASSDPVAVTGSFNWSKSATLDNDENLVELRDPALIALYEQEFCRVLDVATLHPGFAAEAPDPCAAVPQVFINEFLPDPDGSDRGQEYVELVNVGTTAVDLTGWTLGDEVAPVRHTFTDVVLEPGDGLVLFDEGDHSDIPRALLSTTGFLSLNNTGDTLRLVDPNGAVMDEVVYHGSTSGVAWNRRTDRAKDAPFTWHSEVDGAVGAQSPGTRADGAPFVEEPEPEWHVVINELMPNPVGTDLGQEYVELVNIGPDPAPLLGWTLYDISGLRHDFGDVTLQAGEAMVLFDRGDHGDVLGAALATSTQLSLNNTGDALSLYDAEGVLHDQFVWETSREGVAWNRATDGRMGAPVAYHDAVDPGGASSSPGTRADGSAWLP